jgi:hypothetical protein
MNVHTYSENHVVGPGTPAHPLDHLHTHGTAHRTLQGNYPLTYRALLEQLWTGMYRA